MADEPKLLHLGPYVCTRKQLQIAMRTHDETVKLFQRLVWLSIEARKSWVQLPHTNEEGDQVQHGANKRMGILEEYYFQAAQALVLIIPEDLGRDWFPWMYIRNHRTRQGLGLPEWMQWLVDKNGGEIPLAWSNDDVKSDDVVMQERANRKRDLSVFRETGRDVDNISEALETAPDETTDNPGRIYGRGLWIEHWVDDRHGVAPPDGPTWLLTLGNYQSCGTLEQLEEELFEYAVSEGQATRSGW